MHFCSRLIFLSVTFQSWYCLSYCHHYGKLNYIYLVFCSRAQYKIPQSWLGKKCIGTSHIQKKAQSTTKDKGSEADLLTPPTQNNQPMKSSHYTFCAWLINITPLVQQSPAHNGFNLNAIFKKYCKWKTCSENNNLLVVLSRLYTKTWSWCENMLAWEMEWN